MTSLFDVQSTLPWVEKYRPRSMQEVVCHEDITATLDRFIAKQQIPHLLLHGPPGTGKTSVAQVIAKKVYGADVRHMVLELNASDNRGVNVVRDTIKQFAESQPNLPYKGDGSVIAQAGDAATAPSAFFATSVKLIILDEADQMTGTAQMALRRIRVIPHYPWVWGVVLVLPVIENYARFVRFFIICNYVNKIIPALQSRCIKFRFSPLQGADIRQRIDQICVAERVAITPTGLDALVRLGKGDMRKMLNSLQSAAIGNEGKAIDEELLLETVGKPLPSHIEIAIQKLTTAPFDVAFEHVRDLVKMKGHCLSDIVTDIYERLVNYDWPVSAVCTFFPRMADIEYRLCHGADETAQIASLVSAFMNIREELVALSNAQVS